MSMRPRSATLGAFELGPWIEAGHLALESRLQAVGPRPAGWRELTDALTLGGAAWPDAAVASLQALQTHCFDNPQRPREMLQAWRDTLLSTSAARELAQAAGGSAATAALAALLRGAADAVALQAATDVELQRGERLDAANLRVLQRALAETAAAALLRQWRAAPAVAAALRDAPAALERRRAGLEARAVHFGATLASALRSGFDSPGLDGAIAEALSLTARQLATVRRSVAAQQGAADRVLCDPLILEAGKAAG
jgi:hypothetical protein